MYTAAQKTTDYIGDYEGIEVKANIGTTRMIGGMNEVVIKRKELSRSNKMRAVNDTVIFMLLHSWDWQDLEPVKVAAIESACHTVHVCVPDCYATTSVRTVWSHEQGFQGMAFRFWATPIRLLYCQLGDIFHM